MRPTDENQAGSKRPNLMSSSRRANGEINILAMLDGRSGRPLSRRGLALPAALWYASAALLACALVGALAWLAHDGADARRPGHAGAGTDAAGIHAGAVHGNAMDQAADRSADRSADQSARQSAENAGKQRPAAAPAPALAGPDMTAAVPAAMPAPAPAPAPVPVAVPGPAFPVPQPQAGRATVIDLAAPQERLAAAAGMPLPPSSAAFPSGRDGVHPPPPRMQGGAGPGAPMGGTRGATGRPAAAHRPAQPSMARSSMPARPRRPAAPGNPPASVDGDVALITAIIQHTGRAGEQETQDANSAACADRSCGPRMPDRP